MEIVRAAYRSSTLAFLHRSKRLPTSRPPPPHSKPFSISRRWLNCSGQPLFIVCTQTANSRRVGTFGCMKKGGTKKTPIALSKFADVRPAPKRDRGVNSNFRPSLRSFVQACMHERKASFERVDCHFITGGTRCRARSVGRRMRNAWVRARGRPISRVIDVMPHIAEVISKIRHRNTQVCSSGSTGRAEYKRESLYGPALKAMVLYIIGMVHGAWVDHGYCEGFIYS